jgi:hypothetical protein
VDNALFVDPESFQPVIVGNVPSNTRSVLRKRARASTPARVTAGWPRHGWVDTQNLEPYGHPKDPRRFDRRHTLPSVIWRGTWLIGNIHRSVIDVVTRRSRSAIHAWLQSRRVFSPLPILVDSTRRKSLIRWQKRAAMWEHGFESCSGLEPLLKKRDWSAVQALSASPSSLPLSLTSTRRSEWGGYAMYG